MPVSDPGTSIASGSLRSAPTSAQATVSVSHHPTPALEICAHASAMADSLIRGAAVRDAGIRIGGRRMAEFRILWSPRAQLARPRARSLAIVTTIFPPERRGTAFGVWGAVGGLAPWPARRSAAYWSAGTRRGRRVRVRSTNGSFRWLKTSRGGARSSSPSRAHSAPARPVEDAPGSGVARER